MTPKSDEGWSPKGGLKRGEETLGSAANFAELLRGEEVVTSRGPNWLCLRIFMGT